MARNKSKQTYRVIFIFFIFIIAFLLFSYYFLRNSQRSKAQFNDCVQGANCESNQQCGQAGQCIIPERGNNFEPKRKDIQAIALGTCLCRNDQLPPPPQPIPIVCSSVTCNNSGACSCLNLDNSSSGIKCSKLSCDNRQCLCTPFSTPSPSIILQPSVTPEFIPWSPTTVLDWNPGKNNGVNTEEGTGKREIGK